MEFTHSSIRGWGPSLRGQGSGLEGHPQQQASMLGRDRHWKPHVCGRPFSGKMCFTRTWVNPERGGCGVQENSTQGRSKGNLPGEGQERSRGATPPEDPRRTSPQGARAEAPRGAASEMPVCLN